MPFRLTVRSRAKFTLPLMQFVTNAEWSPKLLEHRTREVLRGGFNSLQYRPYQESPEEMLERAYHLRKICQEYGVLCIINNYVEIAKELGIGVWLGGEDESVESARAILGEHAFIGRSVKTELDILNAKENGADAVAAHIFPARSNPHSIPIGIKIFEELAAAAHEAGIPMIGIGGIFLDNIVEVMNAGADGVAVSGAFDSGDTLWRARTLSDDCIQEYIAQP